MILISLGNSLLQSNDIKVQIYSILYLRNSTCDHQIMMPEILQVVILLLIRFKPVLTQSYTLIVRDVNPVRLSCRDASTGVSADIDNVKFWRNRTPLNDLGLREKGDIPVFEDQMENDITFTLTREFEGYYTCGRQVMDTVQESPPVFLVCKLVNYKITVAIVTIHTPLGS